MVKSSKSKSARKQSKKSALEKGPPPGMLFGPKMVPRSTSPDQKNRKNPSVLIMFSENGTLEGHARASTPKGPK